MDSKKTVIVYLGVLVVTHLNFIAQTFSLILSSTSHLALLCLWLPI